MKNVKGLGYFIVILSIFFVCKNVNALETVYYTNSNGVEMTELEYNNIIKIHGEDFLDDITQEMFDNNIDFYDNNDLSIYIVEEFDETNDNMARSSSSYATSSKKLSISSTTYSGGETALISITLKWLALPTVRSYDVIGVRLVDTSFVGSITTSSKCDSTSSSPSGSTKFSNGYGAAVKLKSSCSTISITQSFEVKTGGTVYASYQHAVKSITLSDSLSFTISSSGLGGVFKFDDNSLFDKMRGTSVST